MHTQITHQPLKREHSYHIAVIGGGIVGLWTAFELQLQGFSVTLFDEKKDVGLGTSYANGGQLSYHYVTPLAGPGVMLQALKWLFESEAPLKWRPEMDMGQWLWLWQFARACRSETQRRHALQLYELALESERVLQSRLTMLPDFAYQTDGKLVIYRDAKALAKAGDMRVNPAVQQVVTAKECTEIEPRLDAIGLGLSGGIFTPTDASGDCHLMCLGLKEILTAYPDFRLRLGEHVEGFGRHAQTGMIDSIQTSQGRMACDGVVVANGMGAQRLLDALKLTPSPKAVAVEKCMIYPLQGYSLSIPTHSYCPQVSITDAEHKIVYAKLGKTYRVAALVDIRGWDLNFLAGRAMTMEALARATFPQVFENQRVDFWTGQRPATPTGLPLVKQSQPNNLWLNVGHGGLGFTLAPGSAQRVARIVDQFF